MTSGERGTKSDATLCHGSSVNELSMFLLRATLESYEALVGEYTARFGSGGGPSGDKAKEKAKGKATAEKKVRMPQIPWIPVSERSFRFGVVVSCV